jgi:hypothetical protein
MFSAIAYASDLDAFKGAIGEHWQNQFHRKPPPGIESTVTLDAPNSRLVVA